MWNVLSSDFNSTSVFLLVDHMMILGHTILWSNQVINLQSVSMSDLFIAKSVRVVNLESNFIHDISDFELEFITPFWILTTIRMGLTLVFLVLVDNLAIWIHGSKSFGVSSNVCFFNVNNKCSAWLRHL